MYIEYTIVCDYKVGDLVVEINNLLRKGWSLLYAYELKTLNISPLESTFAEIVAQSASEIQKVK